MQSRTAFCDLHQQRARVQRERGYIITAIGKRSSLRYGTATTGGCFRVGCHGDTSWHRYHGSAAWNIHPLASFPRFPPLPSSFPSATSLFLSLPLSLRFSLSFSLLPPFAFFSPVYIRIHSAVPPKPPCVSSLFLHPCRSFRLFCSQADSPMEATVVAAWPSLSFSLSSSPTSNRASSTLRFYFVTASLIPALSLRCVVQRFSLAVLLRDNDR